MIPKRYPFVVDIEDHISREIGSRADPSILAKDPWIVELSIKRLEKALASGSSPVNNGNTTYEEVASFYLSLIIAKKLGARVLDKFINAEINRVKNFIEKERFDDLIELAKRVGIRVFLKTVSFPWYIDVAKGKVSKRVLNIAVNLYDYLSGISYSSEEEILPQNSFVKEGYVFLDRKRFEKFLIELFRKKVKQLTDKYSDIEIDESIIKKAENLVSRYIKKFSENEISLKESLEAFPPCIKSILLKAKEGGLSSLDLEEGALLANFLSVITNGEDLAKDLFPNDPDLKGFLEIIKNFRTLGRVIPKCDRVKELGLCSEKCTERSPYHAYIKSLKFKPQEEY